MPQDFLRVAQLTHIDESFRKIEFAHPTHVSMDKESSMADSYPATPAQFPNTMTARFVLAGCNTHLG